MKITKDNISSIDRIELVLENCEEYVFNGEDILDIFFDEIEISKNYDRYYKANDGRLILSKSTFQYLSSFAHDVFADGTTALDYDTEENFYFYNRIINWCDVTQVYIYFKNGEKQWFLVEYDPLENDMTCCEIEYSNCPSAELDENGDMLLLFGKSSRSFHRVDNDYFGVIEGLNERFKKSINGVLKVKLETFGNSGNLCSCWNPDDGLYVEMRIQNKQYKNKWLPLQFYEVSDLTLNLNFYGPIEQEFCISPTVDGRYFVQFGIEINFYCKSIKVFEGF